MVTMQQSQRFDFRTANFADIETSLNEIDHVVLDGLWNVSFLNDLLARTRSHSAKHHEMSITSLEMLSPDLDTAFFIEFERAGLPALMRQLLKGDFVAASGAERVIRQVSPAAVWFAGLHADGQLRPAALRGLRSTRELTIWTPFQDCTTETIPRLLLLHRGEHYKDLFTEAEQTTVDGIPYLPIQLKPVDQPGGMPMPWKSCFSESLGRAAGTPLLYRWGVALYSITMSFMEVICGKG